MNSEVDLTIQEALKYKGAPSLRLARRFWLSNVKHLCRDSTHIALLEYLFSLDDG